MRGYGRPQEPSPLDEVSYSESIPLSRLDQAMAASPLITGSRALVKALVRGAAIAEYPGGLGIDYASLLKTSVRPSDIGGHIEEAADHLRQLQVDILFVPGMSGYPVGAAYAVTAGIPALLLKKLPLTAGSDYPPGSFVAPSYTGEGDFVMSADSVAVQDLVGELASRKLQEQAGETAPQLHLRLGGADDIIDKGMMSQAVSESAVEIVEQALQHFIAETVVKLSPWIRVECQVEMVTWVTPLMKGYNRPQQLLQDRFGITPFAGVIIDRIDLHPARLTISGLGTVLLVRQ